MKTLEEIVDAAARKAQIQAVRDKVKVAVAREMERQVDKIATAYLKQMRPALDKAVKAEVKRQIARFAKQTVEHYFASW